jgi:hypothetical protein
MVSLKEKHSYLKDFEDKPKIQSFIDLINEKISIQAIESTNDTDKCYFDMINALSKKSKKAFCTSYEDFTRRKPSLESAWLYNDFLIFVIIMGVSKFLIDKEWIKDVLNLRNNTNQEFQKVNRTFKNILSGNLANTDNIHEVVIVYQELQNQPQLSQELLNSTYLKLSNQVDLIEKHNDFLTVISLRAFDIIITTKDTPDATEINNLKKFKQVFVGRINLISDLLYGLILICIVTTIFKYYKESEGFKDFINDLGAVFSILGIAVIAAIKYIRKAVRYLLLSIFGYNKNFKN